MAKIVKGIAAFSLAATVILAISYKVTSSGILLPLAITSGNHRLPFCYAADGGTGVSRYDAEQSGLPETMVSGKQAGNGGIRKAEGEAMEAQNAHLRSRAVRSAAAYMGGDRTGYVSGGACPRDDRRAELSADFGRYLVRRVSGVYRDVRFVRRVRHSFRHHAAL